MFCADIVGTGGEGPEGLPGTLSELGKRFCVAGTINAVSTAENNAI